MNLAACLLVYSMVAMVLWPPVVSVMTRAGAAPRLGVAVWLAMMGSVLAAWGGAAALLVAQLVDSWGHLGMVFTGCVTALRLVVLGGYGLVLQAALLVFATLGLAALATLGIRVTVTLARARRDTRAHAKAARIAASGTPAGPGGTLVVDSDRRAAYCLVR